jgi:hypothetical protein
LELSPSRKNRPLQVHRRDGSRGAFLPLHFTPTQYAKAYAPPNASPYHPLNPLHRAVRLLNPALADYFFKGTHRILGGTEFPVPPRVSEVFFKNSLFFQPLSFYPPHLRGKVLHLLLSALSSYKLEYFLSFWLKG